jgi:hypothetical protein
MQRTIPLGAHRLALTSALACAVALTLAHTPAHAQALDASGTRAVPTYEAVGLYWSNPGANAATGCDVKFRKSGETTWTQGLAMWFDASANECRGSLVNLAPATTYEVAFSLPGVSTSAKGLTFTTWSNQYPVAQTIKVPSGSSTLDITAGGSAAGYVVYDGSGATLDAQNGQPYNITVNASYVVVRGFTLKGAQQHGILISKDVHDVIIEDNDISGWGRTRDGQWGADMDSGIRAICQNEELTRVTVQRNKIHDPRYPANSWSDGHPAGPQAITFSYCGGNHVFRWNEIYSSQNHFNDGMGGEDNFSTNGFPNADSDIYGNRIEMAWDDAIEAEGADRNVRIWGNYLDNTATGIASTVDSVGPLYIFRNVYNRSRFYEKSSPDADDRGPMFKSGSSSDFGNGRRYLFHNTMLQAVQSGLQYTLGGGAGIGGTGNSQLVMNTVSMNNIYHVWKPTNGAFYQIGPDAQFENDMTNAPSVPEVGGIVAAPQYASGNGCQGGSGGMYQLAAGTPGFDQGKRIPNFNDGFQGAAPDVGAAESGAPAMKFGIAAASATGGTTGSGSSTGDTGDTSGGATGGTSTGGTGTSTGGTTGGTSGATATSGSASVSATMDASSYTLKRGQGVTLTVNVMGNAGTPGGTVTFKDGTTAIAGCGGVALSNGKATCTTRSLAKGKHPMRGAYSGDANYGPGIAGPITVTVK